MGKIVGRTENRTFDRLQARIKDKVIKDIKHTLLYCYDYSNTYGKNILNKKLFKILETRFVIVLREDYA